MLHCIGIIKELGSENILRTLGCRIYDSSKDKLNDINKDNVIQALISGTAINNIALISMSNVEGGLLVCHNSTFKHELGIGELYTPIIHGKNTQKSILTVLAIKSGRLICMNAEGKKRYIKEEELLNSKIQFSNLSYIRENGMVTYRKLLAVQDDIMEVPYNILNRTTKESPVNSKLAMLGSPWRITSLGGLKVVDGFEERVAVVNIPRGCKNIVSKTFINNRNITEVTVPSSVKKIGFAAFKKCSGIRLLEFENGIEEIGVSSFLGCCGLTSIIIPNSVKSIEKYAFHGCNKLKWVEMQGDIEFIGDYAFQQTGLTDIVGLPNKFTTYTELKRIGLR